ncbi:MFS transporter [Thalassiella azotivora]
MSDGRAGEGAAPYELDDPAYRRVSVALFAAGLATFALLYAPQPLLPQLAEHFDLTAGRAALSVSVATFGLGAALLVAGPLSEVRGRVRLMHWSLGLSSLLGLLVAVAPTWDVVLGLRTAQGFALAGLPAVAVAYLREELSERAFSRATGLYIGGTALGGMTGRLLAGVLAEVGGWRWSLGCIAVVAVACTVLVVRLLPPSRRFSPAPTSWRHLGRQTAALLRDPVLVALFAVGGTAMGAFVAVYNATGFRLAADPYRLGPAVAGSVFVVYALGSVASTVTGRVVAVRGRRPVLPVTVVVMAAGLALTAAEPLWLVVVGLGVLTTGFFAAHGLASGWVAARAHLGAGGTAQASSLYLFSYYLGSSVFGGLAGTAWAAGGWAGVLLLTGALVGVTLALAVALVPTTSLLTPPPSPGPGH